MARLVQRGMRLGFGVAFAFLIWIPTAQSQPGAQGDTPASKGAQPAAKSKQPLGKGEQPQAQADMGGMTGTMK